MRFRTFAAAVACAAVAATTPAASGAAAPEPATATYRNAVSQGFADTFADPVVIRGKDGYWYSYGTSDPLRQGEGVFHRIPIARSTDLATWQYIGDALAADDVPAYAEPGTSFWAPDVRYLDGRYVMYFTVTDTKTAPGWSDFAIGAATAPTPAGPWTVVDEPVVAPRPSGDGRYFNTIDPAQFTDVDGRKYLYFGGYFGGIHVTELSPDGLRAVGTTTRVTIGDRYEGAWVVRRGGYYYFFGSSANCCAGPTTGYAVFAGRATSPRGPFVDRAGVPLTASRVGGTPVVAPNGNTWIGTGHNGHVTDLSGQDYLVYHAIDRTDPFLDQPYGVNERPMLIDRLDWIDGWPVVRAGAGPSEGPQPAPVTRGIVHSGFADGLGGWRTVAGDWQVAGNDDTAHLRQAGAGDALLLHGRSVPAEVRVEADVRLTDGDAAGLVVGHRDAAHHARVTVDRAAGALVVEVVAGARRDVRRAPLPAGFSYDAWHSLAVDVHSGVLRGEVSDARLGDPVATVSLRLPRGASAGPVGVTARGGADVDNVSATRRHVPVTRAVPTPKPGELLREYSDEFTGPADAGWTGAGWSWVRRDTAANVADGSLNWPTQAADLVGTSNTAGALLRDLPATVAGSRYLVETKVTLDLGVDTIRNYQQAGLVLYAGDDDFARLCVVAIWGTRQVEFARELPFAGQLAFGGGMVGTPATTTWLRLAHHVDPANGEHEFRAASSTDGRTWTWGGVWTFPAGTDVRVGLVSQGGSNPPVTAQFDYLRMYRW